jgi:phosphate:Na+ symporter
VFALNLEQYAPLALVIGLLLNVAAKGRGKQRAGAFLFSLGLVFFGLHQMGEATKPLQQSQAFLHALQRLENPLLGALGGALGTALIQSSSAMLGIIISFAANGLISLPAGVAVMLGAEIGTCSDTLLATAGRSREAVRAGLFHLLFNVMTVLVALALAVPFTELVRRLFSYAPLEQQIANAHVMFNLIGALAVLPLLGVATGLLRRIVPERRAPAALVPDEGVEAH